MSHLSGKKKEPKPKLFGPDIFQWGRGLPREWVGTKKFDMSLETQGIELFGRDIPGFCPDIPGVPEKFEKKKVRVQFPFPNLCSEVFGITRKIALHPPPVERCRTSTPSAARVVASGAASHKASRHAGVWQLPCRVSRYNTLPLTRLLAEVHMLGRSCRGATRGAQWFRVN